MKKQQAVLMAAVLVSGMAAGCRWKQEPAGAVASTAARKEAAASGMGSTGPEEKGTEAGTEKAGGGQTDLIVFAAASMAETLEQIAGMYGEANPDVNIICTFDSSGTLKTQIQEGAACDIFISAAQKQMDQLDSSADPSVNTEGLDFVLQESRFNLVENKVVLAVPDGNPADIQSFEDLGTDKLTLVCLGNDDVPAGAYSKEILESIGILEQLEADFKITYGSNVKEVATQVKEASVDCGVIYATDALSAGLAVVDEAEEGECRQVVYPAAVLNISENQEKAQAFLDYLAAEECSEVFKSAGFTMARQKESR